MKLQHMSILALTFIGLLSAGPSHATVIDKDIPELATESDRIVVGTVRDMRSAWAQDGSEIFTDVTLDVDTALKGTSETVTFRLMGGVIDDLAMVVPDSPAFQVGDRALVFLRTDDDGILRVWGWYQGAYIVQAGLAENETLERTVPLEEMEQEIEDALR
jgi:hypothetical protein